MRGRNALVALVVAGATFGVASALEGSIPDWELNPTGFGGNEISLYRIR